MIGGQYLDITGTASDLASLHRLKTGCLFAASVGLGLWAAEVPEREQPPWRAFGDELGLLFQVVDDILDEDGYVLEHGTDGARRLADESAERARAALARVDADTSVLEGIVDELAVPDLLKKRLDVLLVERGLAESRAQAQALVLAGQVPGYEKAGQQVDESAELTVTQPPRFVSRGGEKLDHALEAFELEVAGRDCARRRRLDGRVHRRPAPARRRARDRARRRLRAAPSAHPRRPAREGAGADERARASRSSRSRRSSSSATSRSSACARPCRRRCALAAPGWEAVVLVKPQFEAGRAEAPRGVVRDPDVLAPRAARGRCRRAGLGGAGGRRRRLRPARPEGEPRVLPASRPARAAGESR